MRSDLPGLSLPPSVEGSADFRGRALAPEQLESRVLLERRTIRIWLPPSYEACPEFRYPVLYLHDGQNMLSVEGPQVAYGWGTWEIDRSVERLVAAARMREVILVAVYNTPRRYQEYRGRVAPGSRTPGNGEHERYAAFLITELKPIIDRRLRTLPEPDTTGLLGASMGGLCSLVLSWDHPQVFGVAASLSGAFQVERAHFLQRVLRPYGGPPKPIRIYLDSGASSGDGGDDGRSCTAAVTCELRRIGWRDGVDLWFHVEESLLTADQLRPLGLPEDKFREAQVAQHNELYWRQRVWRPLQFLFPIP